MTNKERGRRHETYIANLYDGIRSPSSGAASTDAGDVRVRAEQTLFECKCAGAPGEKPKNSTIQRQMAKIMEEAYEESRNPALALRYFNPSSSLADSEGWVDLVVRRAADDAERSHQLGFLIDEVHDLREQLDEQIYGD